jgi:multiple sugar transport system permease protein
MTPSVPAKSVLSKPVRKLRMPSFTSKHWEAIIGYLFIAPTVLLVFAVLVYPTFFNLGVAVREWSWSSPASAEKPFVGFDNFTDLFRSARFANSLTVSLSMVIGAIAVEYVLGLGLALALNRRFFGRRAFRTLFILPMILTPIVIGIQWRYLLSGNFGVLNFMLASIGMQPPAWLSNPRLGVFLLILVDAWMYVPFVTLILLAGLQQIPLDVLEAAQVDGATQWQRFWRITFPLLRSASAIALLLRGTEIFRAFDIVYVLTGGGPGRSTEVLGMLLYRIAFGEGNLGQAAALSIIIGAVGLLLGTVLVRAIRTETRLF